jgi:hypothetical protein
MGIDLGSGNIDVTEQFLHGAQVGPALEQVGSKGVAQDMGADLGWINSGR